MKRDGTFINPLTLQSPPAEPIPEAERPAFFRARDVAMAQLDAQPQQLATR
jgi:hypothetical protein